MTQVIDQTPKEAPADTDLGAAIQQALQASSEPLTLPKLRNLLPGPFRRLEFNELTEVLRRQVAANVVWQYPKYRSSQDRYWDRPMTVHIAALLSSALEAGPLAWSELRRKLPAYAQAQAEAVLQEQIAQAAVYRHPRAGRSGERYGLQPAEPKNYLRLELVDVFRRLEQLGFNQAQLREAALELLHEEEWSASLAAAESPPGNEHRHPQESSPEAHEPETRAGEQVPATFAAQTEQRPAGPEPSMGED